MRTELADMLQGASGVLAADGCALVGGHSAEAAEPALGFAVTGLADPAKLLRKSGLRPGDALVLTKPLGTGIVLAAHMRGLARAAWLQAAIASMRTSNADGVADAARVWCGGVHRRDRLRAGRASVGDAARIRCRGPCCGPIGCRRCRERWNSPAHGVESTLAPENRRLLPGIADVPRTALLFDPQTSGGLLAGIAWDRAEACVVALRSQGIAASVVGVVEQGQATVRLEWPSNTDASE